jgi:hypothetical protein
MHDVAARDLGGEVERKVEFEVARAHAVRLGEGMDVRSGIRHVWARRASARGEDEQGKASAMAHGPISTGVASCSSRAAGGSGARMPVFCPSFALDPNANPLGFTAAPGADVAIGR